MSGEYNPSPEGNPSLLARRNRFQTALVKFIGRHTPKCREVVRILSQSMDSKLSLTMRIKLRLHYLICAWCQRYEKQLHELRKFASSVPDHVDDFSADTLSPAAKERLKEALREERREWQRRRPATKIADLIRSRELSIHRPLRTALKSHTSQRGARTRYFPISLKFLELPATNEVGYFPHYLTRWRPLHNATWSKTSSASS